MSAQTYKCGGCDKTRNALRFSNTAIRKYEESLRKSQRTGSKLNIRLPRCQDCSGQQRHELECSQCGVVKGLDAFSKQMRKNPDNAECIDCVQEREDREPDHRVETEEQEIIERLRNGVPPTVYGSGRSVMGYSHQSNVLSNSRGLNAFSNADDDGWIQPPVEIPEDPRNKSTGPADLTNRMRRLSVNSNATQQTYQSNATRKTTGSQWEDFEKTYGTYHGQTHSVSGRISSTGSNVTQGGNPGFVKQGAVKTDRLTKAQIALERERRRKQEQEEQKAVAVSDSDDDDDSDEDPESKYGF